MIWEYRNKMEFTFSEDLKGNKYLGLIQAFGKGRVLSLSECHLASPWLTKTLQAVRSWWEQSGVKAYSGNKNTGSLRTLTLREGVRTGDRMAMLTISGNPDYEFNKNDQQTFVDTLNSVLETNTSSTSIFLRIQHSLKGIETHFDEIHLQGPSHMRERLNIALDDTHPLESFIFQISPTAFFQPNTRQAEKLYAEAIKMSGLTCKSIVYDLYCGTGTLGIIAAKKAERVIGIEINPHSVLDAKANAALNGIDNITFMTGAVKQATLSNDDEKSLPHPDIVFVDPPRIGLDREALEYLIDLAPLKILYISCNPITQAENIRCLIEKGYRIASVQPIDQFPHTPHIENIVLLQKSSR